MKLHINNFFRKVLNTLRVFKTFSPAINLFTVSQNAVAKAQINKPFPKVFSFILLMVLSESLLAAAGDDISNTATVNYTLAGNSGSQDASTTFTEDRIINFAIVEDDGAAIPVIVNMTDAVMKFKVENTGNAIQDFLLTALNSSPNPFGSPADDFDVASIQVFVEEGTTPGYQILEDTDVFIDELASGLSVMVYVVSDMPAAVANVAAITLVAQVAEGGVGGTQGAAINADDNSRISPAGTYSNGSTPVLAGTPNSIADSASTMETVFNDPEGLNPEDISTNQTQDAKGNGQHSDTGAYQVTSPVIIVKSVDVIDTLGGTDPHTGATLRYELEVTVVGNTAVDELVIKDSIPANTTYVSGSILLNGVAQTDADDAVDFSQAIKYTCYIY